MKTLTGLTLSDLWRAVKTEETLWGDLKKETRLALKEIIREGLEVEMVSYLRAQKHERTEERKDYRNGTYLRDLETGFGLLENIPMPRSRSPGFKTEIFKRYSRRKEEVEKHIKDMFLAGVSTRRVGEVLEPLLGFRVSAQTVSKIVKSLDAEVFKFHERVLEDKYTYLFLDGITLKARNVLEVKKRIVLVAYGVTKEGKREILNFRQAPSESENSWLAFLNDLYKRGLIGKNLKLIITDGCPGLTKALEYVYPYTPHQRCWVHKIRNISQKLPKKKQKEVLKGVKAIYKAENRREAIRKYWEWAKAYRNIYPKAVKCLEKDLDELLSFFDFPKACWRKIRTTNAIERAFREVRRRTRPMSSFSNYKSVDRIIYGIIHYINKKWKNTTLKEFTQFS